MNDKLIQLNIDTWTTFYAAALKSGKYSHNQASEAADKGCKELNTRINQWSRKLKDG